jgi:chemotaxis protein methyltransferase CheR
MPVQLDGAIVHRKRGPERDAAPPAARLPFTARPAQIRVPRLEVRTPDPREAAADAATLVQRARDCADRGELEQARAWCEQALAIDKLDARSHYLLASVLQALRQTDAAANELRRTLYLEPRHVLAHYALGRLARRQGRAQESLRHFRNALRAIDAWAPEEAARAFEGMDATRLAEVIRASMKEETRA